MSEEPVTERPMVSVVVPVKDGIRTIEACLRSIRAQTWSPLELIVIDNFSSDGTWEVAQRFAHHAEQAGPERSAQRNLGIERARGPWVLWIDADMELPLGNGESMLKPVVEGRALQALLPQAGESVLEIGTGSGYFAALLGSLAGRVTSVEIREALARDAAAKLARAGFGNVSVATGDGARGWGKDTYDAIVLTGSTPVLHDAFFGQLAPGGRLFAIVGDAPAMSARIYRYSAPGSRTVVPLFETVVKPLVNAPAPARFEF